MRQWVAWRVILNNPFLKLIRWHIHQSRIRCGFTTILEKGCEHPQCVVCFKVLSEHSMEPSLLKRHLSRCHPELLDRDVEFFTHKEIGLKRVRLDKSGNVNKQNQAALRASYMVAKKNSLTQSQRSLYYRIVRILFAA